MANVLVLGVLAASAFLIYLVVKRSDERGKNGKPPTVLEQYEVGWEIDLKAQISKTNIGNSLPQKKTKRTQSDRSKDCI